MSCSNGSKLPGHTHTHTHLSQGQGWRSTAACPFATRAHKEMANTKETVRPASPDTHAHTCAHNNYPALSDQALCVIDIIIHSVQGLSPLPHPLSFPFLLHLGWIGMMGEMCEGVCGMELISLLTGTHGKLFAWLPRVPLFQPICETMHVRVVRTQRWKIMILPCQRFLCLPKHTHMVNLLTVSFGGGEDALKYKTMNILFH